MYKQVWMPLGHQSYPSLFLTASVPTFEIHRRLSKANREIHLVLKLDSYTSEENSEHEWKKHCSVPTIQLFAQIALYFWNCCADRISVELFSPSLTDREIRLLFSILPVLKVFRKLCKYKVIHFTLTDMFRLKRTLVNFLYYFQSMIHIHIQGTYDQKMPGPLYISQYVKTHFHINILYVFKTMGRKFVEWLVTPK